MTILVVSLVPHCWAGPMYTYTRLPPPIQQPTLRPTALSADGTVVAGTHFGGSIGYYWTSTMGVQSLIGQTGPPAFRPGGTSADGSVIVGTLYPDQSADGHAFRWDSQSGAFALNPPEILTSYANATNLDGSVIVGTFHLQNAFRWTQGSGMQALGALPESLHAYSEAYGVSHDGSVIVGTSDDEIGYGRAVAWVGGSIVELPTPSELERSVATVVTMTSGGPIIAGYDGQHAVRWTPSGVDVLGLGDAFPTGISADGNVIVGNWSSWYKQGEFLLGGSGFIWTPSSGMVDLSTYLGTGRPLNNIVGVSADGRTIVGFDSSGWMVQLAVPEPSGLTIALAGAVVVVPCLLKRRAKARPSAQ